ncbi:FAD-containing oxidoreductase [Rhodopseudomonas boonkerdii]|uniref:FAD-containing oxidoreductase n=1 Tax=Rhodopseudomonas boonkerdii TaxID=475937 RepID=UPI001E5FF3C3|nr:FAD-containing oxidoreductase [Rhodopseudomonas boonkerdii]UGV24261.1 FAD-containing oxidoreductase [Rhodopseudomonas boonkerdii]
MAHQFDAIIIGTGQAGPPLAGRLTAAGQKVAVIERHLFGGTCVNTGCKPTKTMVASAYAAHLARRGSEYGVMIDAPVRIDMVRVRARADKVTMDSRSGVEVWLRKMTNCTVFDGHARFESATTVRVGDELLTAPKIFVNVGGRPVVPDFPGVNDVPYLTNSGMLKLDRVPKHLVVVGGSYIGLEFAQMYRRFGAEVTVVEKGPRLVSREDSDISEMIREILEAEGIHVRTSAECITFKPHPDGVAVGVDCSEGEPEVIGSDVLLAVGRQPNTDDLGLDKAGVEVDERGYIKVDDGLATGVPGIYAMGDCNGRGAFTHTAYNDFEIIVANLLDGQRRKVSDRIPGYALFIDPPLGRVGMTVTQAKATGKRLLIGERLMKHVGRAVEKGETFGKMQVIVDAQSKKILGAAILGTSGDEAIHGILDIMNAGADYTELQWAVPVHPTVSELIPTLLGSMKSA